MNVNLCKACSMYKFITYSTTKLPDLPKLKCHDVNCDEEAPKFGPHLEKK